MAPRKNPDSRVNQPVTAVRFDGETNRRLDAYCVSGKVPVARAAVVEIAIKQFLVAEEAEQARNRAASSTR